MEKVGKYMGSLVRPVELQQIVSDKHRHTAGQFPSQQLRRQRKTRKEHPNIMWSGMVSNAATAQTREIRLT